MSIEDYKNVRFGYANIRKGNRKKIISFWSHGRRFILAVSTGLLFIMFAFLFVSTNHQAIQTGYDITKFKQQQLQYTDINQKLKVELANLTSLKRLEMLAKSQLGLIDPKPNQVVELR